MQTLQEASPGDELRPLGAAEIAGLKIRLNLTAEELGAAADTGPRSVHAWISGSAAPRRDALERLHALEAEHREEVETLCRGRRRGARVDVPSRRGRGWALGVLAGIQRERPDLVLRLEQ